MMTERDTHFVGFAKLLVEDLLGGPGYIEVTEPYEEVYKIIAQRAYDLVEHTLKAVPHLTAQHRYDVQTVEEITPYVPDLTQRPDSPTPE